MTPNELGGQNRRFAEVATVLARQQKHKVTQVWKRLAALPLPK